MDPSALGQIFSTAIPIVLTTLIGVFVFFILIIFLLFSSKRKGQALKWMRIDARIIEAKMEPTIVDNRNLFAPYITYKFIAKGKMHSGKANVGESMSEDKAHAVLQKFKPGSQISVRFDPHNPDLSVLDKYAN